MAKSRLESTWEGDLPETPIYFLDLIQFRSLSNLIAEQLNVVHQSPQLILVENGNSIYHASHSSINSKEVVKHI